MGGRVDTIVIGGTKGETPDITVFSYKDSTKGYMELPSEADGME